MGYTAYLYDIFHRCDSLAGWSTTLCALALDSTKKIEGKYSIKMTPVAAQWGKMDYSRTVDWLDFNYVSFSQCAPGYTNETGTFALYTDAANYKSWTFHFSEDWETRNIDITTGWTSSGGTLDYSNITYIRISETIGELVCYFDFISARSAELSSKITYLKITEPMGVPSVAELEIKGDSLDVFKAGLELQINDSDGELSWRGRILYPESVMEGTEVIGKLKAIGVDTQFENTYRKNFTTVRDSDYIIKNIIDNALTKYHSYDDEIDNFTLTAKYDLKTKIQKMFLYLSMLERAVIGYKPDGEIFFNKYDNLSKGPQIYQGTYNFEDDDVGSEPDGWTSGNSASCTTTVIASLDGHKKVLQLYDNNAGGIAYIYKSVTQGLNTTIELWIAKASVANNTDIDIYLQEGATVIAIIMIEANDLNYYPSGGPETSIKNDFIIANTFFHIKIILDDTANTFDCYIGGVLEGSDLAYANNSVSGLDRIVLRTNSLDVGYYSYVDAIGVSTDADYTVGDNLKCWDESTSKIRITSYTPAANRNITRAPVIGANNDLGQVYYVGKASEANLQKYGLNYLQTWRDPEITNYTEAKQLGDNLLAIYSLDTQMISMLVVGKGHLQVGKTLNLGWAGVFSITQGNFLLTKRVWKPIPDISELELTDNILTRKAFNVKVINKFYDEDAQQSYDFPDVAESTVAGTVMVLRSVAQLRAQAPIVHIIAGAPDVNYDVDDGVEVGDFVVDTAGVGAYICLSNTSGAADWNKID